MTGETDLAALLGGMKPVLDPRRFHFSTHPELTLAEAAQFAPIAVFQEPEGLTLITESDEEPRYAMITLTIHSSLEAVGLTTVVSSALSSAQISANVVAAFYHDHVFVPERDAERALDTLKPVSYTHLTLPTKRIV